MINMVALEPLVGQVSTLINFSPYLHLR